MDIRADKPWHIIYKDENGSVQRSMNFSSREGVLAKAHYLSLSACEIIQILDEDARIIEIDEIDSWRKRNLDIWLIPKTTRREIKLRTSRA